MTGPGFDEARTAARAASTAAEAAREAVTRSVDRLARARAEHDAVARRVAADDPVLQAAEAAVGEAEDALTGTRGSAATAAVDLGTAVAAFGAVADPRRQIARLSDDVPLLLLPLRLETRFLDGHLLVRVYPDEIAVDRFEPRLSGTELENAGRHWATVWAGASTREARLTAWRGLVAAHGSGRAAWILEQYRPVNAGEAPTDPAAADVVLVVAGDAAVPAGERTAVAEYWEAVWQADGAADDVAAADAALVAALGAGGADAARARPPANLDVPPPPPRTHADATVAVVFLQLPAAAAVETRRSSWTTAPRAHLLPDRFVLLGYVGGEQVLTQVGAPVPPTLAVGPDPSAAPADQLHADGDALVLPPELRWMAEFEEAVAVGMAFRVPLTPAIEGGLDRLLVAGVRLRTDAPESAQDLATLLAHHLHSRDGFGLVPQGTPTNNIERLPAGHDRTDDADRTFVDWFERPDFLVPPDDVGNKRDGQWLAEYLGIDPATLRHAPYADATDQREARAGNVALWPATWGYFLETMMAPVLAPATVDATRAFFVGAVSGRGPVPAIRVGRQPYGVLPTTALSRLSFEEPVIEGPPRPSFLDRLGAVLRVMGDDWAAMAGAVRTVGSPGDPHATLLDLLGLHPASVEFHQRHAESVQDLWNRAHLGGFGGPFLAAVRALGLQQQGVDLLVRLGRTDDGRAPDILARLFLGRQHALRGPLVDDRPLSETAPVRAYTDDGRNYLTWLRDAASTSLETLRREDGFSGDTAPTALLYLLLRHALLLGWWDSGLRLRLDADVLDTAALRTLREEPPFVHVAARPAGAESRWEHLYTPEVAVTDDADLLVAEYIPTVLGRARATRFLAEQIAAIDALRDVPTARLERVLVEHLDTAAYRLDAWRLGLVTARLGQLRQPRGGGGIEGEGGGGTVPAGIHLGAYGWLEDLRPDPRELTPVELDEELTALFPPGGDGTLAPLQRDSTNGGHVHAPSLNHAATAAILRAGHLANAGPDNPGTLAVNLSSRRVRTALAVLEGVRNGQPLAALLGYGFERGLHDRHDLAEVDRFIAPLRKRFPLVADHLADTATGDDVPVEAVEARNVVDGLALARHTAAPGQGTYPFGLTGLPGAEVDQQKALDKEAFALRDTLDAVADLALAEGVHQAVLGNPERVAATLDAYGGKAGFPPEPAVVATPRSGTTLLHRVAVHLPADADPLASPVAGVAPTPRSTAEPVVDAWLASLLPAPADVACRVEWTDPADGTVHDAVVTQEDLGLQPIDLLYVLAMHDEAAMGELDDRVAAHVHATAAPRPDTALRIRYTTRLPGQVTFFELAPLVDRLRAVVQRSRPLVPTDVALHSEAETGDDATVLGDRDRVPRVVTSLQAVETDLAQYAADLAPLLADPATHRTTLLDRVDEFVDRLTAALGDAARHGVTGAGWGVVVEARRAAYADLVAAVAAVATRWRGELDRADALVAAADALPPAAPDEEAFALLQQAERLLTTTPTTPRPATPAALRAIVVGARVAFTARLAGLDGVATTSAGGLAALLTEVRGLLPLAAFDPVGFDLAPVEDRVLLQEEDLLARADAVRGEVADRIAAAGARLAEHDAAADPRARVDALTAATRALLGADMVLVPAFRVAADRAAEWQQARGAGTSGTLLAGLGARDFPVDDWLAGVARVRDRMRDWERVVLLTGALTGAEPAVVPVQLPYRSDDRWLALEFPPDTVLDGDRLLYTAHFPPGWAAGDLQCGLLLDEWTELLPVAEETTGLAFHCDTPDSEPPNALLLVVPPVLRGAWRWDDVVATLHETLDLARTRAVEPAHVDATPYAQFLPATVTAATARGISIATNFAVNNAAVFREAP